MYQKMLRRTTLYCFVFFMIAMTGMFYFDANKIIVIADSAATTGDMKEQTTQYQLLLKNSDNENNRIIIPLEDAIMAEDVTIQNHYIDHELWIGIEGATTEFYSKEYVTANLEKVSYGGYDLADQMLWIKFSMNDIYEFKSTMNNGKLTIEVKKPQDVYKKIIVLDAGHGGNDKGFYEGRLKEKDVALDVLLILQEKLQNKDIKVYFTRTDDSQPDNKKRVQLANSVKADMLISIHTDYTEDESISGVTTIYNGEYFIPEFNSISLSDMLEQSVAKKTGAKANGLLEATEEDYLIKYATVPAAQINIGYLSNKDEKELLAEGEYQKLIAEGIYDAIMKIYEEKLNND